MRVDEIRESRATADTGHRHDVFVRELELFEHAVKRGEDREVAAAGASLFRLGCL